MQREDIVFTNEARVASIELDCGEESPWHFHSEVIENIICLNGQIKVQHGKQGDSIVLSPGQRYEVPPKVVHNLVNLCDETSTYLLIQKGAYDFVPDNP